MSRPIAFALVLAAGLAALPARGHVVPGYPGVPIFAMPSVAALEDGAAALAGAGAAQAALAGADALVGQYPLVPSFHALRAEALSLAGRPGEALDALERAVALGLRTGAAEGDAGAAALRRLRQLGGHAALRSDARFARLIERLAGPPGPGARSPAAFPAPFPQAAPSRHGAAVPRDAPDPAAAAGPPEPAVVTGRTAPVGPGNTRWNAPARTLESLFRFPPVLSRRPAAAGTDPAARRLVELVARGRAAGHAGDLYDNRDAGHSAVTPARWPQLSTVVYGAEAQAAGVHYGLNPGLRFDAVTLGNSSTAITAGAYWRSLPRAAMTRPGAAARLHRLYAANHLYVFPEHRDHDPDNGDLFPAALPAVLVSQGSSGSDQPILDALAHILGALRPDTKAFLRERGLVAATAQMLFRRHLAGVAGDRDAYLGPAAHPSVFRAGDIDPLALIEAANALAPDRVPPMVELRVEQEPRPRPGIDAFVHGLDERLFDTPTAIARIWRSTAIERRMVLDASATRDPNGRRLSFHWRVLRGDPDRIRITPLDPAGSRAEVVIGWHAPYPVPGRPDLRTHRVDIGVFADNGAELSAPSILSIAFPPLERREIVPDARGGDRLAAIDYRPDEGYADPALFLRRDWADAYEYDARGRLLGWTRTRASGRTRFTRHGLLVRELDAWARPLLAERVVYPVDRGEDGRGTVAETPTGELWRYVYAGGSDRLGTPTRAEP